MKPRERVHAALRHQPVDRVPRFEIWIDALLEELGFPDTAAAHAGLGQDSIMMPSERPPGSAAWGTGVDEWGRIWRDGMYVGGVVDTAKDLQRYSPPLEFVDQLFDPEAVAKVRRTYPDHCLVYGTHIGPFMAAYMAMGLEQFFYRLADDPAFIHELLEDRTAWAIAQFGRAVVLGAEIIVVGDDAAHKKGPMISPALWRELILPYHRRLVQALPVPVIWHSDGDVRTLLPMAIEAGFVGFHGLEPAAGIDLARVKSEFGRDLVLIGNLDVRVLCESDLGAVRREVDRCLAQGGNDGGYMLASCNSIFEGMNAAAVGEMFRYQALATARMAPAS